MSPNVGNLTNPIPWLYAMGITLPRMLAMFSIVPLSGGNMLPIMIRSCIAGILCIPILPGLVEVLPPLPFQPVLLVGTIVKEAVIGFALGMLVSIPFLAFESLGLLIDNQRGATIASSIDPLHGNEASPLGLFTQQVFVVLFLVLGGFHLLLDLMYQSYALWPPQAALPPFSPHMPAILLAALDRLIRLAVLFAAPAMVTMLLSEVGLALVAVFSPRFEVFFLAVPIKSALAFGILILYLNILFESASLSVTELTNTLHLMKGMFQ